MTTSMTTSKTTSKKVLILGSGGREHALCLSSLIHSEHSLTEVYLSPGNAGTKLDARIHHLDLGNDAEQIATYAASEQFDLVIPGPEALIAAGITDACQKQGVPCFAPNQKAAQLEASKGFAKEFMRRHNIPTAEFVAFSNYEEADAWLQVQEARPLVFKADGLAAGKGVVVSTDSSQHRHILKAMMTGETVGDAGSSVVIEEFLPGEELTYISMVCGDNYIPLASSQDHKPLLDADRGPNTGGMGAYSPAPICTPDTEQSIVCDILEPTIQGIAEEMAGFTGFLYIGLMVDSHGKPRVVEYNVRFGDPEAQAILTRLDSNLADLCIAMLSGQTPPVKWQDQSALTVVLASAGYPTSTMKLGCPLSLYRPIDDVTVHFAGVAAGETSGTLVNSGGRVLAVTVLGDTIEQAARKAYITLEHYTFEGAQWRSDIGHRAINRDN